MFTNKNLAKLFIVLSALVGLYPVQNLYDGIYKFTFKSSLGIWTLLIISIHIVIGQSYAIILFSLFPHLISPSFEGLVILFLSGTFLIGSYLMCIVYFYSLPKFFKFYNLILKFDLKFVNDKVLDKVNIVGLLSFFGTAIFDCAIAFMAGKSNVSVFEQQNASAFQYFQETSILMNTLFTEFDRDHWFWLSSLHLLGTQLCTTFSISHIMMSSTMFIDRINLIQFQSKKDPMQEKLMTFTKSTNSNIINYELVFSQLIDLLELFEKLKDAWGAIILGLMTSFTVSITICSYYLFSNLSSLIKRSMIFELGVTLGLYLFISILKLVWMTSRGETLLQKGESLQRSILCISPTIASDKNDKILIEHLKQLSRKLEFKLTAYGLFHLNRATVTSILSAIITYNIVLIQFMKSEVEMKNGS